MGKPHVRTVADVRVLEAEFKNKRGFKQSGRVRKEMVPDWLSQDTGEVDSQTSTPVAVANDECEEEKRKLEAELKALHEELKAGKEWLHNSVSKKTVDQPRNYLVTELTRSGYFKNPARKRL